MKVPYWFVPAVFALIMWGVWGVFQKLATMQMPPRSVYFISAMGAVSVVILILFTSNSPRQINFEGSLFAVLAGICSSLGGLLFLQAMNRGEASIVITFTALYPVISILLSFALLKETISVKQSIGIILALFSMVLLA